MKLEIFKPTPPLSEYVRYYWLLENTQVPDNNIHRVIPNGLIELLISYGDDFTCAGNSISEEIQPKITMCGQKKTYFDIRQTGKSKLLSVLFTPAGASVFVPFDFTEIVNLSLNIDDIFPMHSELLLNQIIDSESSSEKIKIIESYLLKTLRIKKRKNYNIIKYIIDEITNFKGQVTIDQLCHTFNLNAKNIERLFNRYIGMPPKTYLRIIRFQRAIHYHTSYRNSLTNLCYDCGYYDQPHFIKEIKTFSGYTPTKLFNIDYVHSDFFIN